MESLTAHNSPRFPRYVISGIHTGSGKTLVSAMLVAALDAYYWKPVQSGTDPETDTEYVERIAKPSPHFLLPEAYRLSWPASPHASAAKEGVEIQLENLTPPQPDGPLIIEGAGGLMVPLSEGLLFVDVFREWNLPVVLVADTYLGSINHTLLSIEALKARNIPIKGIVFNDGGRPESEGAIALFSQVPVLGRVPRLAEVNRETLREAFHAHFSLSDWQ